MRPICKDCQRFFRPKKNGVYFVEVAPGENDPPPGCYAPDHWHPYKLWCGDLWHCPDCGSEIIVGVGREPVSEHFKPDFEDWLASSRPVTQVNDC